MAVTSNESDITENYFGKELFLLKLLGISFMKNESRAYKVYSFIVIASSTVLYPILQMGDVFKSEFSDIVDVLTYVSGAVLANMKAVALIKCRKTLGNLLTRLNEKPFVPTKERGGDIEAKLIKESLWISSIQTYLYCSAIVATVIIAVSYSLINDMGTLISFSISSPSLASVQYAQTDKWEDFTSITNPLSTIHFQTP